MLTLIAQDIWTCPAPFSLLGLQINTRMTVVRYLDSKQKPRLWIHSPVTLTPGLRETLGALGTVAHVVSPSLFHHIFMGDWLKILYQI